MRHEVNISELWELTKNHLPKGQVIKKPAFYDCPNLIICMYQSETKRGARLYWQLTINKDNHKVVRKTVDEYNWNLTLSCARQFGRKI